MSGNYLVNRNISSQVRKVAGDSANVTAALCSLQVYYHYY